MLQAMSVKRIIRALNKINPIIPRQRRNVYAHPLSLGLAVTAIVSGFFTLLSPELADPKALLLPHWELIFFLWAYFIGGIMSAIGIARGVSQAEATGFFIVACTLIMSFIALYYQAQSDAFLTSGQLFLAFFASIRVIYIIRHGQV